jgi:NAD(P)-dependent dehydrogenase (short-subunit alcohol dehydrogenase family)
VVINVASMPGMIGFPKPPMAAHAAANAGLIGLTRQFAVEGAPVGIREVNISPGAIVTREADLDPAQRNAIAARTLLKRWEAGGGRRGGGFPRLGPGFVHHRREHPRRGRHDFLVI